MWFDEYSLHEKIGIGVCFVMDSLGMMGNVLLCITVIASTPENLRFFSKLVFVSALVEAVTCTCNLLTMPRLHPFDFSPLYVYLGPCAQFGSSICSPIYTTIVTLFPFTIVLLVIQFTLRLYVISREAPSSQRLYLIIIFAYLPFATQWPIMYASQADEQTMRKMLEQDYGKHAELVKQYSFTGCPTIFEIKMMINLLIMTAPMSAAAVFILLIRRKILSIQSLPPLFVVGGGIAYLIAQFDNSHPLWLEQMSIMMYSIMPMASPFVSLWFIRPYREFVRSLFCSRVGNTHSQALPSGSITGLTQ